MQTYRKIDLRLDKEKDLMGQDNLVQNTYTDDAII